MIMSQSSEHFRVPPLGHRPGRHPHLQGGHQAGPRGRVRELRPLPSVPVRHN